jgi:hypothetical protein
MGSRSVNLVEGPPSPLLCAPARRPARLLGYLASPRLLSASAACCLGCLLRGATCSRPLGLACTPAACTSSGAPTRSTSYWEHPLSESNAPPAPMQLLSKISLIPPTTTDRLPHVGYGGSSWNQMIPPDSTKIPLEAVSATGGTRANLSYRGHLRTGAVLGL